MNALNVFLPEEAVGPLPQLEGSVAAPARVRAAEGNKHGRT